MQMKLEGRNLKSEGKRQNEEGKRKIVSELMNVV